MNFIIIHIMLILSIGRAWGDACLQSRVSLCMTQHWHSMYRKREKKVTTEYYIPSTDDHLSQVYVILWIYKNIDRY